MNKTVLALPLLAAFLMECHTADLQSKVASTGSKFEATHFNLIFAPDLSNRVNPNLHRRALSDMEILSMLTKNLYPSILRHKRAENQLDKFRVDFINKGQINLFEINSDKLLLDFGQFHNQHDRIAYIMQRPGTAKTLQKDTSELKSEFYRIYNIAVRQQSGSDIWSYFHLGIDDKKVLAPEAPIQYNKVTYINTYRNILILTTDGYIEAGIFNKGFDLSQNTVNRFRNAFLASGEHDMKAYFIKNSQFRIKPVHNQNLKNLEVLVMELQDRSLTHHGIAKVHPVDMEIIKLFWEDWLQQSNVKRFELHPCAASKYEAEKILLDFIGIKQKGHTP